jgi:uncharacterized damage-inducible protein DinB
MNREMLLLAEQMKAAYQGEPWYGRSAKEILSEIDEGAALEKPAGQHSILELLWHMILWKEFVISRLTDDDQPLSYFEQSDWRELDHSEKQVWKHAMQKFDEMHSRLVEIIQQQTDDLLSLTVKGKKYDFRKLLYGLIEHDIYHLGQIAYVKKLLEASGR